MIATTTVAGIRREREESHERGRQLNGVAQRGGGYTERPAPSGLADVIDIILDKGLVVDAYVRVSLVGIELLTSTRGS